MMMMGAYKPTWRTASSALSLRRAGRSVAQLTSQAQLARECRSQCSEPALCACVRGGGMAGVIADWWVVWSSSFGCLRWTLTIRPASC